MGSGSRSSQPQPRSRSLAAAASQQPRNRRPSSSRRDLRRRLVLRAASSSSLAADRRAAVAAAASVAACWQPGSALGLAHCTLSMYCVPPCPALCPVLCPALCSRSVPHSCLSLCAVCALCPLPRAALMCAFSLSVPSVPRAVSRAVSCAVVSSRRSPSPAPSLVLSRVPLSLSLPPAPHVSAHSGPAQCVPLCPAPLLAEDVTLITVLSVLNVRCFKISFRALAAAIQVCG